MEKEVVLHKLAQGGFVTDDIGKIDLKYPMMEAIESRDIVITSLSNKIAELKAIIKGRQPPKVSRILKSRNRTIVFWADGTQTIVKRAEDEAERDYNAFCAALGIKLYGSNSALKRIVERTETQKLKKHKGEK